MQPSADIGRITALGSRVWFLAGTLWHIVRELDEADLSSVVFASFLLGMCATKQYLQPSGHCTLLLLLLLSSAVQLMLRVSRDKSDKDFGILLGRFSAYVSLSCSSKATIYFGVTTNNLDLPQRLPVCPSDIFFCFQADQQPHQTLPLLITICGWCPRCVYINFFWLGMLLSLRHLWTCPVVFHWALFSS